MAVLDYVERAFSYVLYNVRGHDSKLFTRDPLFSSIPRSIPVSSDIPSPMPVEYTQIGSNSFPPLTWSNPPGTREVLLVVQDADAPLPSAIVHCLCYGISPEVQSLAPDDFKPKAYLEHKKFTLGSTLRGLAYSAPRPLLNHGEHRYFYQVIALSKSLQGLKADGASLKEVKRALQEANIIAWGEWVGIAERRSS